jgi:Uma2 family endonuclease
MGKKKGSVTMAPALAQEKSYTIDDIYSLPEGSRAELIDGQIYYMAPPTRKHQRIVGELFAAIREYINRNNGICEIDIAPFAVFLNGDDTNYVEPDISVICDPNKLTDKGCFGAPDWIIEIVSPDSRRMDYYTKLFKYRTAGVREYWIVDPEKNRILVYDFESENTGDYSFADSVKVGIYDDLYINFSDIADLLNI